MNNISDLLVLPDLQKINDGDHLGYLYLNIIEQVKVIGAWINSNAQRGNKILCILQQETKYKLLNSQENGNHDLLDMCGTGQLVIEDNLSLTDQYTDSISLIQELCQKEKPQRKAKSFNALAVALDTAILLNTVGDSQDISSRVDQLRSLMDSNHCSTLFLYPQHLLDINTALTCLSNHPNVLINGKIYRHDDSRQFRDRQQLEDIIALRTKELAQTILDLEKEISKRQQMAAYLVESEQRYRALVDESPAPIFVIQGEKFIFCNQAAIKMLGISRFDDLIGKTITSIFDPSELNAFLIKHPKTRGNYQKSLKTVKLHRQDGESIHFESVAVPITYSGKSACLMIGYDVTERVNAENALKQSEETSRTLINAVHEAFYLLNPDGRIMAANNEGIFRFNTKPNLIEGASLFSFLPPKAEKEYKVFIENVIKTGKQATFESRHKQKFLKNTIYPIFNEQNQVIRLALYSRDITDRVRTEKALQRHAQEMEALYSTLLEITTHMDLPTLLNLIVMRAATILDESSGGLYLLCPDNETLELVVSYNQEKDLTGARIKVGEGLSGKIAQHGQPMFIADYSNWEEKLDIYSSLRIRRVLGVPLKVSGIVIGVINISSSHKTVPYTEEEIRLVSLFADQAAIAIENTRLLETAQYEIEERKQVTEALKASLAEKEVMLREIHHRVKNNLNVIIALLDLQEDSSNVPEIKPLYNDLKSRVRTMALVHENLYKSADLGKVNFANYIKTLTDFLLATYATQLPIQMEIDIPPIPMSIDTAIPCGLIVNELVTNAIKYAFPLDQWMLNSNDECRIRIQLKENDNHLVLSICDNGVGIPPDVNWKASNTLGLLLVNTLTNQLNGSLEKIPEKGTGFIIRFKPKA